MAFHRIADGSTLARLDPYAEGEQTWLLHSGRTIAVTAAEVRDISHQVHGLELPASDPRACNCGVRLAAIEARLAALEGGGCDEEPSAPIVPLGPALDASIEANPDLFGDEPELVAEQEINPLAVELDEARQAALAPLEALKAKIDRVRQTGSVDPSSVDDLAPLTTADLINMVADDPPGSAVELEDAVRAVRGEARRRFSEQLNVELAELKNSRGMAGEDLKREQQVEYLLGLFARVGEI